MTNKVGILLMLVAIGMLIPGVSQPILVLNGTVDKSALVDLGVQALAEDPDVPAMMVSLAEQMIGQLNIDGDLPAYHKSRSIVGTIDELFEADQLLVAVLIALFSIVVPASKCLLMILSAILTGSAATLSENIIRLISKWSMADVFVVAIIVAYLAANATQQTEELFSLTAEFAPGFYYFLAYCLLSILSMQLMNQSKPEAELYSTDQIKPA